MKNCIVLSFLFCSLMPVSAQLKFLVEDFEGLKEGTSELSQNGIFTYGNLNAEIENKMTTMKAYSGKRSIVISKNGKMEFGGWGKGLSINVELNPAEDHFNFYVYLPASNGSCTIRVELQDDDNADNNFKKEVDDTWAFDQKLEAKNNWELISIPLSKFKDSNPGGDGTFNISYRQGKLFGFMISFLEPKKLKDKQSWYFDFICFSKGKLPVGADLFDAPKDSQNNSCTLGAWSNEGNTANFIEIASAFESNFNTGKRLGVVHFFQPFGAESGKKTGHLYPSIERINKVIDEGYIPLITLEDHFVNPDPNAEQPNLYSIVEGHFDSFFGYWAHHIKQIKGLVYLRIFHEFNGDWYPWCTVKNDKNPQLVAKAYRYIHNIFKENNVTNVRFVWCPNSMSIPQESWNFIMEAYPGDEYVDCVGLDIYNGAGRSSLWRSFRKEGIENYFVLTQRLPSKPLFICEVASRERRGGEQGQNKAEWIEEMSEAVKTDMSKIKLLAWFNEKETFRVNSSDGAKQSFLKNVWNDNYFKSGSKELLGIMNK
jgi:hypothetical protein